MFSKLSVDACRGPLHRLQLRASGGIAAKHESVQTIAGLGSFLLSKSSHPIEPHTDLRL